MLTIEKVKGMGACHEALGWAEPIWNGNEDTEISVIKRLMKDKKYTWVNWLIVQLMNHNNKIRYAIFAAEQVTIEIYEKKYPEDKRPCKAVDAAKLVLKNDTEETRVYALDAGNAAACAGNAAYVVYAKDVANAAYAAYAIAYAVYSIDTANAARYAANATAYAVYAVKEKLQIKILEYGLKLLKTELK